MAIYKILILVGAIFGLLGACIAYLITWNEGKKRGVVGKSSALEGLKMAAFTLIFFILLSVVLAFAFTKLGL